MVIRMLTPTPDQIKAARKLLGMTLRDLGEKAGLDASAISRLESSTALEACAEALREAGIRFEQGCVVMLRDRR
jgi:transcriptional regulator with XRE-family HTH domain